jgi:lysophospholipase L1-like esterase
MGDKQKKPMKLKHVHVFFIITLLLLLAGQTPAPTVAYVPSAYTPKGPGDTYLALGDSLATGVEAAANNDNQPGYPAMMYEHLQQRYPELRFENVGVSGETSSSMLNNGQLDNALATIASERTDGRRVGLVTLGIGGNDAVKILLGEAEAEETLAQFKTNLDTIVSRLLTELTGVYDEPQGDLLLMKYYNPYPGLNIPPTNEQRADIWLPQVNAAIEEVATRYELPVAEVADAFAGREEELLFVNQDIYEDPRLLVPELNPNFEKDLDYHPTAAGHQVIAQEFLTVSGVIPPEHISFAGPTVGSLDTPHTFIANVEPTFASIPRTYAWQPAPETQPDENEATYRWSQSGVQTITVSVANASGAITRTHTITITEPIEQVEIRGPTTGNVNTPLTFQASIAPQFVKTPVSYTWTPTPQEEPQDNARITYTWETVGVKTINVTAANSDGTVQDTQTVTISGDMNPSIAMNEQTGAPGSTFIVQGKDLLREAQASVSVNDYRLSESSLRTSAAGALVFNLASSEEANNGTYAVQVELSNASPQAGVSATQVVTTLVTLDATAPMRRDSNAGSPTLSLPASVEPLPNGNDRQQDLFLPIVAK